jgi:hypothetical protein
MVHESVAEQLRTHSRQRFRAGQKFAAGTRAGALRVNRTSVRGRSRYWKGSSWCACDGRRRRSAAAQRSGDVVPALIYRAGRLDTAALAEVFEVIMPLFFRDGTAGHQARARAPRGVACPARAGGRQNDSRALQGRRVLVLVSTRPTASGKCWPAGCATFCARAHAPDPPRCAVIRSDRSHHRPLRGTGGQPPQEAIAALRSYIQCDGRGDLELTSSPQPRRGRRRKHPISEFSLQTRRRNQRSTPP